MAVALALGLGTMVGWKRIVVTVGEKIGKEHLTYAQGASAGLVTMATIFAADQFGLPVSTTHILSSGVAGTMLPVEAASVCQRSATSLPAGSSPCPLRLSSPGCSTSSSTASPDLFAAGFASKLWFLRFLGVAFGRRRRFGKSNPAHLQIRAAPRSEIHRSPQVSPAVADTFSERFRILPAGIAIAHGLKTP